MDVCVFSVGERKLSLLSKGSSTNICSRYYYTMNNVSRLTDAEPEEDQSIVSFLKLSHLLKYPGKQSNEE